MVDPKPNNVEFFMCRLFNFLRMSYLNIGILNVCLFLLCCISWKLLYWKTNSPLSYVASNQPLQTSPLNLVIPIHVIFEITSYFVQCYFSFFEYISKVFIFHEIFHNIHIKPSMEQSAMNPTPSKKLKVCLKLFIILCNIIILISI